MENIGVQVNRIDTQAYIGTPNKQVKISEEPHNYHRNGVANSLSKLSHVMENIGVKGKSVNTQAYIGTQSKHVKISEEPHNYHGNGGANSLSKYQTQWRILVFK